MSEERIAGGPSTARPVSVSAERIEAAPRVEPMVSGTPEPPEPSRAIVEGLVNPTLIGMSGTKIEEGGRLVDFGETLQFEVSIFDKAAVLRNAKASVVVGWGFVEALADAWKTKQAMDTVEGVLRSARGEGDR